jgi:hypothetical protein
MVYRLSFIAGIILLIVSLFILRDSLAFIEKSERATGAVTMLQSDGEAYTPVFHIKTKSNEEITYVHTSATSPPSWEIGETATFLYDPGDPHSARMFTYFGVFSWTIVLSALATFFITIGSGYYLLRRYLN